MGKIKSCLFTLENPWDVYRPGDSVSGTATVEIEGQLKVRAIKMFCKGQALTKWKRFLQKAFEDDYESTEVYCNKFIEVYKANPPALMAAGTYNYNFLFVLPSQGLPSSFEGFLGAIRYWITLEVDKPFPSINDRFNKCFTVLSNLDINEAVYRRPVRAAAQKPLSKALGMGHAGTLTASVYLDRSAYCPGEQICINLEAKNDSTKDLGLVKASLVQRVNYKAAFSTDSTFRTLRTVQSDKLGKGESVKWADQLMAVDLVPPSSTPLTCHIIQVTYAVKMEVEVPLGLDLEVSIPITIGTIPLGVALPSESARIQETVSSSSIKYALCTAGYQKFDKTSSGFPNLSYYIPRTVIVKAPTQQQVTANKNTRASVSPAATHGSPVVNTSGGAAALVASHVSQVAEPTYSKATEANQVVPDVVVDSAQLDVLPTYEEACANQIPPHPVPQHTQLEPGSGSILMLLFPCKDMSLVGEAFKRNTANLLLHGGRVLASIPETQLLTSQPTAAVLIRFDSERIGLSWLQNITYANADLSSRWHAFIGENKKPNEFIGDPAMYRYLSVKLFKQRADFKHSKSFWDEYNLLLNQVLVPLKEKHAVRTLVSGKVIFACGDWTSFPARATELTLVVTGYSDLLHREAYMQESGNSPEVTRFHELFMMYCKCLFNADYEVGDIATFQDM